MRELLPVGLAIIGVTISACGQGADACRLDDELRSIVGRDATDCGVIGRDQVADAVRACVSDNLERGHAFFAIHHLPGIDSEVATGWAGTSRGELFVLSYDSDPSGGSQVGASIGKASCERPSLAEATDAYEPLFECEALVAQDDVCGS